MSETNISVTTPVTGYDFVASVLSRFPEDGVERLLKFAGSETDWFEKKAGVYLWEKDVDLKKLKERNLDEISLKRERQMLENKLCRTIAEAIIALRNVRGGVVFIGIGNATGNPVVPLRENDPKHFLGDGNDDFDEYIRNAIEPRLWPEDQLFREKDKDWRIPKHFREDVFETRKVKFRNETILALLVKAPTPSEGVLVLKEEPRNGKSHDLLVYREPGSKGENRRMILSNANQESQFLTDIRQSSLRNTDLADELRRLGISISPISDFLVKPPKEVFSSVRRPGATNFVGRIKELAKLHDLLQAGRIPIVTGPGGTGKSELAFQYAERHKKDYPGGLFQINMESAKNWEDVLRFDLWRSSANGVSPQRVLGLEKGNGGGEESADASGRIDSESVLRALRQRANSEGDVLLVLDNVESAGAFFIKPKLEKLNLPAGVHMIATARSCDSIFRTSDHAVEVPLPDLSLDEALDFLLKDRPAKSSEERLAAVEVARLLAFRPLHLISVPAKLDETYSPFANSWKLLAEALRENLLETVEDAMKDYGEEERIPSVLWKLTQQTLLRHPGGASWVKLAHVASFLTPVDSRMSILLRHLWGAIVAPDADAEKQYFKFKQAVDVLRRHGILSGPESDVRIHCVTAEVLRKSAHKTDINLEEAIGKALAGCDGMGPMDWLAFADNVSIVKFTPRNILLAKLLLNDGLSDASVQLRILLQNPDFHVAVHWDALTGSEFATILSTHPQLADKCDWAQFNGENWVSLLCQQPQFAGRCDWAKLDGHNWAGLLSQQPMFADKCPWDELEISCHDWAHLLREQPIFEVKCTSDKFDEFDGQDWAILLGGQPKYADGCPWEKLGGQAWSLLLSDQPQFAGKCPWEKLGEEDWMDLLERTPQFAERCPWSLLQSRIDTDRWVYLICKQPEFARHCPWERLDGDNWAQLLGIEPDYADRCDWSKLSSYDWIWLLGEQPQFEDKCPFDKFDGRAWASLLREQQQFASKCPWDELDGYDWANLLGAQPQFANMCQWQNLDSYSWSILLSEQPQFADRCPLETLDGEAWARIMQEQPQFAEQCAWGKLTAEDWAYLLGDQPQFAEKCPWDELHFDGAAWGVLLDRQPQFEEYCPFNDLSESDCMDLLYEAPQFAEKCPLEIIGDEKWCKLLKVNPGLSKFRTLSSRT